MKRSNVHPGERPKGSAEDTLGPEITIRPFADGDAAQVRELFIATNRLLSPPDLRAAFEAYIERSLAEEIDRIAAYYREHGGGFWVAIRGDRLVGCLPRRWRRRSSIALELDYMRRHYPGLLSQENFAES
jgi:hypothetical protein